MWRAFRHDTPMTQKKKKKRKEDKRINNPTPGSFSRPPAKRGQIKGRILPRRKCRIMRGEMFRGKYAQKDASKVNTYKIAQLSRASAAPAKSCAEVESASQGEGDRWKRGRD